ncbi:MAB_1171c family putative transporter [Kutzneria albida]|uniref:Putative membrane protein n=1 Tax=Kutzneria albida DSM 43870 TaxID=1449976 RepID=W5W610_9PSEU|nr:MAB_1171c family putative transporter [Kutzneria albida]AHH95946.1 putative membrane protein [Kutzneria albida DSM 43870]
MSVDLALRWLTGGALVAIALWELVQLARRREDLALRVLCPGLVLLAVAATVGIKTPALAAVKAMFGGAWPNVINGCWMAMAYCFSAYFLLADNERPLASRKRAALVELGLLVAAITVMVVVHDTAPPGTWAFPGSAEAYRSWQHAVFYLSVDGYALAVWFVGVRRASALRRRLRHPWARAAFWLVIVGSAGMALGVDAISLVQQTIRAFAPRADLELFHTMYSTGQLGGQLLLALGLALAPLATAFVSVRTRYDRALRARYSRRMTPLWRVLVAEFPYIALDHGGEEAFETITVEITDGLAELARDCPGVRGDTSVPGIAAGVIAEALDRRGSADGQTEPPYPRIEPDFPDWRGRARWMIGVSEELTKRGVIREDDEHGRVSAR